MIVKKSEFMQFVNLHTEVKQYGENVVIYWYDNPPEPKEPFAIRQIYGSRYSIDVNKKAERNILACAMVFRPSANSYKVAFSKNNVKNGVCELTTFKNYDEIISYLTKQTKTITQ